MRKINPNDINLNVFDITGFNNDKHTGVIISWDSTIGFGEYIIYQDKETDKIYIESEYMDSKDDKSFGKKLLESLLEKAEVK